MERDTLIQKALELGHTKDELQRLPNYSIQKIIKHSQKPKKYSVKKYTEQVYDQLEQGDDDDTQTVFDMEHLTSSNTPADQKYNRFKQLKKIKKHLEKALIQNSEVLKDFRDRMDPDDILKFEETLNQNKKDIELAKVELLEIDQWFKDAYKDRLSFYQHLIAKSSDVTGQLTDHFQVKILAIQKYMALIGGGEAIQHDAEPHSQ